MPDPMIPLSNRLADEQLVGTLSVLATEGFAEGFFGSITHVEASAMADFLLSHGSGEVAGKFMASWADSDEDWEEHNEDGDVDAWFALIPEDERQSWVDHLPRRGDPND